MSILNTNNNNNGNTGADTEGHGNSIFDSPGMIANLAQDAIPIQDPRGITLYNCCGKIVNWIDERKDKFNDMEYKEIIEHMGKLYKIGNIDNFYRVQVKYTETSTISRDCEGCDGMSGNHADVCGNDTISNTYKKLQFVSRINQNLVDEFSSELDPLITDGKPVEVEITSDLARHLFYDASDVLLTIRHGTLRVIRNKKAMRIPIFNEKCLFSIHPCHVDDIITQPPPTDSSSEDSGSSHDSHSSDSVTD